MPQPTCRARDTKMILVNPSAPDQALLQPAADCLRNGGLVAFPTETVYGIGANAYHPQAVRDIFTAKGRPQDNPLIVHIAALDDLEALAREIPDEAYLLSKRFWPGPFTMTLPKSSRVTAEVSGGLDTVAVRMPSHPVARRLIRLAGAPVVAPSANLSGTPSPTTAAHCIADLSGRVDYIIDGGPCSVGLESTVISLTSEPPRLLRPGAVTPEELREFLPNLAVDPAVTGRLPEDAAAPSPGMKYKHYAPKAEITLIHGSFDQFRAFVQNQPPKGALALVFDSEPERMSLPCVAYGPEGDPSAQAEALFAALRALDDADAKVVYARAPSAEGIGLAVYNRLLRAASFREIHLNN